MSKPVFEDMFSFSGRRNRKSYVWCFLALSVPLALLWSGLALLHEANAYLLALLAAVPSLLLLLSLTAIASQRCRDFDWNGWAMLLALLPGINVIFVVAILFIPGTDGPNRFGPDPKRSFAHDWPENWAYYS